MAESKELKVQEKKELVSKEEQTVPAKYYVPYTDIYETEDNLAVVMDMPGVQRDKLDVTVEKDVLKVEGKIDFANYDGLDPLYTEYNVGHFTRSFNLSNKIDQEKISAKMEDGVLTLILPKAKEAKPRQIKIS
ncbi:MAG: Hsp20/alpha crystallin family protein [Rhodospirillales bacterium]|nr:Hsp20/alpha crystallin family protein [Rhodospirillales bacterium]